MPTTYKSSADPFFYQRKLAQVGQLAQPFIERRQQREQEERERAMGRMDIALQAVAAGGNPQDSAVEAALRDLEQIDPGTAESMRGLIRAMSAPKPKDPGEAALERMVAIAEKARGEAMNPPGQGVLLPEVYQQQVRQGAQTPPGQFFDQARSQMGLGEQMQAAAFAKQQGMPLPGPPGAPTLPPSVNAMLEAEAGRLPPKTTEAVWTRAGQNLTKYQQSLEKYRKASAEREEQRMQMAASRDAAVSERSEASAARQVAASESKMRKSLEDLVVEDNLEKRKEYSAVVRESPREKPGERPPLILRSQAARLADAAMSEVKAGRLSPEEAREFVVAATAKMEELMAQGSSANDALRAVLAAAGVD